MKKLPVDIERKLGMIKAKGIKVEVKFCYVTHHWDVKIGNEKGLITDDHLPGYIENKLKEILK